MSLDCLRMWGSDSSYGNISNDSWEKEVPNSQSDHNTPCNADLDSENDSYPTKSRVKALYLYCVGNQSNSSSQHTPAQKSKEFLQIGLIANMFSIHHAGHSSSTQNPRINFNWSDKQPLEGSWSHVGLMNQNISEMPWCVPLFCTLWILLWFQINTWKSWNHLSWQSYWPTSILV